jgi:hypothetical protein
MRAFWMGSEICWISKRVIRSAAYLGAFFGLLMVVPYLLLPGLWPSENSKAHWLGTGVIMFAVAVAGSYALYEIIISRRPSVRMRIREIPKDFSEL